MDKTNSVNAWHNLGQNAGGNQLPPASPVEVALNHLAEQQKRTAGLIDEVIRRLDLLIDHNVEPTDNPTPPRAVTQSALQARLLDLACSAESDNDQLSYLLQVLTV